MKTLVIHSFFYDYSLLDAETKYKPEAAAASVVPKSDKIKGSAIQESPTTMMETEKYKPKFGMLTQNYSQNNIR